MILIQTIFLAIIEGLTEFIPVSSVAHHAFAIELLGIESHQFVSSLFIFIQSAAILAVIWFFWKLLMKNKVLIAKIFVGFIPVISIGIILYPNIKLLFENKAIVAIALIVGGVALALIRPVDKPVSPSSITYKQAFWLGAVQIFSFIPGTSRVGATLIGGTFLKIPRSTIVTFSFLLAIPTILVPNVVEIRQITGLSPVEWIMIAIGMMISFVITLLTIKFFIKVLTKKPLWWFGLYRIVLGAAILIFM